MCPHCRTSKKITKRGSYTRPSDKKKIRRFHCKNCLRSFSTQTSSFDYRLRKRHINQRVFRMLAKGASQRGCAESLGVRPTTIARRVTRFGACARSHLIKNQRRWDKVQDIVFDEMETFEHTKLKPLTIPLAVENHTRKILALDVARIAAKGSLAAISRKKYGQRKCERRRALFSLFTQLKRVSAPRPGLSSDESNHYPPMVRKFFKDSIHHRYKGRKPAVTGQGEMKKGGFDPLFSLNHTAAMLRDNIKRLARKTWCTTKRIDRLLDFLHLYAFYHNQRIAGVKQPRIWGRTTTN